MNTTWIFCCVFAVSLLASAALADDVSFGEVTPLGEINSLSRDQNPVLTNDGLRIFFASDRFSDDMEIFEASREDPNDPFGEPRRLSESVVSSGGWDVPGWVSPDGLRLYFFSNRRTFNNDFDIYIATRDAVEADFDQVTESRVNTAEYHEGATTMTGDERQLFFVSNRFGGTGGRDIWLAMREKASEPFAIMRELTEINTTSNDRQPTVTSDGLMIIWDLDGSSLWIATRATTSAPFGEKRRLGDPVNAVGSNSAPWLLADASGTAGQLYFTRSIGDGSDRDIVSCRWQRVEHTAPSFLRGDANDDGNVDIADPVFILNWLFGGGPAPGCLATANSNGEDGVIDISDPTYLLHHLFAGGPGPLAPYPGCGTSGLPVDEELGCETPPTGCQ